MLDAVERAGVFGGYLEDLCYTPKTLKALQLVQAGQLGQVTWVRSRETHPGPHSAWFWDANQAGGGAIVDLGCHCIDHPQLRGKENRPLEVVCWTDTLVHPIEADDNAIALIRFESGAMGQFEVSGPSRRDGSPRRGRRHGGDALAEPLPSHRFRGVHLCEGGGYVAEKAELVSGWLFPVGDEVSELGYVDMFSDMFDAMEQGRSRWRPSTTATW